MNLFRAFFRVIAACRRPIVGLCLMPMLAVFPAPAAHAQTARKPSYFDNQQQLRIGGPDDGARPVARRVPSGRRYLDRIAGSADFNSLARVYNAGTPFEIPHLIFVIDRQHANRIYYVATPRYELHERFVREQRLLSDMTEATLDAQYRDPQRRFLFGTLSWQRDMPGYTYEFWEGDRITPDLLKLADKTLRATFYDPLRFKTNSTLHETTAQRSGLPFITQEALLREQTFLPLNTGKAQGRLRIVTSVEHAPDIAPDDIVVLSEVPVALPPVAGIITERPSTLLSHVNLLAKGWRIPNAYIRNAVNAMRPYDGQWVELVVTHNDYQIRAVERSAATIRPPVKNIPAPDLSVSTIKPLDNLRTQDSRQCGVKAANLGALKSARLPIMSVPDGFCIPFAQFTAFIEQNRISQRLAALEQRPDFAADSNVRRQALALLRQDIIDAPLDPALSASWTTRWSSQLQGQGVFVRSSSNSEDLPDFSGAGLYTTVPNVTQPDKFAAAVKTVWASVYNFEAYEARRAAGFPQDGVVMAVLVQLAVASDISGVMITRDPFDAKRPYVTYISAKRGLGIKVVEGKRVAEQVMYSSWSKAVQVLSRSAEDTQLIADAAGGVREVPITGSRIVLSDSLVERLAAAGKHIKQRLGGVDQDIEWAVRDNKIVILQARPYVDGSR